MLNNKIRGSAIPWIFACFLAALLNRGAGAAVVLVSIVDSQSDEPIAGATIARLVGTESIKINNTLQTTATPIGVTNQHGEFNVNCDPAERSGFVVTAAGKAPRMFGFWGCIPATYQVKLNAAPPPLRGTILDSAGHPLAGATVRLSFSDFEILEPVRLFNFPNLSFSLDSTTDASGRFLAADSPLIAVTRITVRSGGIWNSVGPALDDPVWWNSGVDQMLRNGTFFGHTEPLPAGESALPSPPATQPSLTVHLRVLDAVTNLPIPKIRISPGGAISPDQAFRTLSQSALDLGGENVIWSFYDGAWSYFLRVEAEGYSATPTRMIKASEKSVDLVLKLTKASEATIAVRNPDGRSAPGAKAFLATPTISARVNSGSPQRDDQQPIAVAGADGIIRFSPPAEPYRLAIFSADGSAEVAPSAQSSAVKLQPWASIDLNIGSPRQLLGSAVVQIGSFITQDQGCWIDWSNNSVTDASGHVTIPTCRAAGLQIFVFGPKKPVNPGWRYVEAQSHPKPGEHLSWQLMAGNTTVRAVIKEYPGYKWSSLWIEPAGPAITLPTGVNELPVKERDLAVETAFKSAPAEKPATIFISEINVPPGPDGSISASGLGPGTYLIGGFAQPDVPPEQNSPATQPSQPPQLHWYFTIPNTQPANLDLGTVSPSISDAPALQIGQVVPDLNAKTFDGKPFSLRSCRGRWVLLDFWGTWCGFCVAEEPTLKDAYEGWAIDGRLIMVSTSVDDTAEQVRRHVEEKQLPWTQLVLGPRDKTDVPRKFAVDGYPTIMLISPEGKVVEMDLRGTSLRDALVKTLGPPAPPTHPAPQQQ
jgi:thiol-disulfide isomerase/thioredoxin